MANEQYVFLDKSNVPDRDAWQSAITQSGFDLQLDPELKVGDHLGYAPCKINGVDAGVEIYFDDDADFMNRFQDIAPNKDYCISFRWGGSMTESRDNEPWGLTCWNCGLAVGRLPRDIGWRRTISPSFEIRRERVGAPVAREFVDTTGGGG